MVRVGLRIRVRIVIRKRIIIIIRINIGKKNPNYSVYPFLCLGTYQFVRLVLLGFRFFSKFFLTQNRFKQESN